MEQPLVAIQCMAFNHEPFIRDALEGFVRQKTNFPFVAIVHDDVSTDDTAEIIREYAQRYPNIIKPIFETENQFSKRDNSITRIMNAACKATGAKYIAFCEGDDYWTDPLKLQKQVDFLEAHPDYAFVHSNAYQSCWKDNFRELVSHDRIVPEGQVYMDILKNNFIYTLTVMIRSDLVEDIESEIYPIPCWDRIMWICFSRHTKFHYLKDITGTYRVLKNSSTHGDVAHTLRFYIQTTHDILCYLEKNRIPQNEINLFYSERCRILLRYSYLANNKEYLKKYWDIINNIDKPHLKDYLYWYMGQLNISGKIVYHIKNLLYAVVNRF